MFGLSGWTGANRLARTSWLKDWDMTKRVSRKHVAYDVYRLCLFFIVLIPINTMSRRNGQMDRTRDHSRSPYECSRIGIIGSTSTTCTGVRGQDGCQMQPCRLVHVLATNVRSCRSDGNEYLDRRSFQWSVKHQLSSEIPIQKRSQAMGYFMYGRVTRFADKHPLITYLYCS